MAFREYLDKLINSIPHQEYIVAFVVFCILLVALIGYFGWKRGVRYSLGILLLEYIVLIFNSTVFFRKISEVREFNLTPFWSYSQTKLFVENLMNVVIFMPIGLLLVCV